MATSQRSQVEFTNVPRGYEAGTDIVVTFKISSLLQACATDRVGVFRVGWSTARDVLCWAAVELPLDYMPSQDVDGMAFFEASLLPNDDNEFYQYCYMNDKLEVCGISKPFQFKRLSTDDFLETEEADMLIVTSKSVALEENLLAATRKVKELNELKNDLEENRKKLVALLEKTDAQLQESSTHIQCLNTEISELKGKNEMAEAAITDLKTATREQALRIFDLEQERNGLVRDIEALQEQVGRLKSEEHMLRNELDGMSGKVLAITNEKELFQGQLRTTENMQKGHMQELSSANRQLDALRAKCAEQEATMEHLQKALKAEQVKCEQLCQISCSDRDRMERLREQFDHAEDKLAAAESCKRMFADETGSLREALISLNQQIEEAANEKHNLKQALVRANDACSKMASASELKASEDALALKYAHEDNERMTTELAILRARLQEEAEEVRKAHVDNAALIRQQAELESICMQQRTDLTAAAELTSECAALRSQVAALRTEQNLISQTQQELRKENQQLQAQIVEMKLRLQAGEREWVKLHREKVALAKIIGSSRPTGSRSDNPEMSSDSTICDDNSGNSGGRVSLGPNRAHSRGDTAVNMVTSESGPMVLRRDGNMPDRSHSDSRPSPFCGWNDGEWDALDGPSSGEPLLESCCICRHIFDPDWSIEERNQHVNGHLPAEPPTKQCPVCSQKFEPDYGQIEFETHVHQHFSSD